MQVVVSTPQVPPIRRSPVQLPTATAPTAASHSRLLPFPFALALTRAARRRCSIASNAFGTVGCLIGITTGWALLFGLVGLGLGLLGMQSKKDRELATMGLVLSVIAIFLGIGQIGFDIWTRIESQRMINEFRRGVVE